MRILLTGHHGYIGSVCGPVLAAAGHDVVGLDALFYRGCDLPSAKRAPAATTAADVRDVRPAELEGFDFAPVSMRNATAYGVSARLRIDLVLNNLVGWAYTTGKVKIMSDGTPWRPLIHIEDIARATLAVLEAPRETVHGEAFNVGRNEENYQVRDLA